MSHRSQSSGVTRSDYEVPHEDVTHARNREYYSSPLRNISEGWFSDIFTLKKSDKSTGRISGKSNWYFKGNLRWFELKRERLRVYVSEKKPWIWIARKLGRIKAAVKVRWNLINR